MAGKFLLQWDAVGDLATRSLCFLSTIFNSNSAKGAPQDPFPEAGPSLESLRQERGKGQKPRMSALFSNNQFKINYLKRQP